MARRNENERDWSYGGYYGTSSDGGYTSDYDKQNRSGGRDGGREIGATRSMRGNDYYRDADNDYRNRGYERSQEFGTRAYGDMSGGSGYGHSNYGSRQNQFRDRDQYNTGPYEDYIDYSSRNYGSFGGSREQDYNSRGQYNTGGRGQDRDTYSPRNYGSGNFDRNQGFGRSFSGMPQGYGSTRYDERDLDRERSVMGNRANYNRGWDQNDYNNYSI